MQGTRWFASDVQGPIRMSDGDPRTGMFPQMWVTTGDTSCSVKGVLVRILTNCFKLYLSSNFHIFWQVLRSILYVHGSRLCNTWKYWMKSENILDWSTSGIKSRYKRTEMVINKICINNYNPPPKKKKNCFTSFSIFLVTR